MGKVIQLSRRQKQQGKPLNPPVKPSPEMSEETKRRMEFLNSIYDKHIELLKKRGD